MKHWERFLPNGKFKFDNAEAYVHSEKSCRKDGIEGRYCVIHNPSTHHMRDWAMILRESALVERRCRHGIGHPDPDSQAFFDRVSPNSAMGIHGCDGCCRKESESMSVWTYKRTAPKVLKVEWRDSGMHIDHGWATTAVYQESVGKWNGTVTTIGALMFEDDNVIVIGLSHDVANDTWYGAQLIYKPCIISRKEIN